VPAVQAVRGLPSGSCGSGLWFHLLSLMFGFIELAFLYGFMQYRRRER